MDRGSPAVVAAVMSRKASCRLTSRIAGVADLSSAGSPSATTAPSSTTTSGRQARRPRRGSGWSARSWCRGHRGGGARAPTGSARLCGSSPVVGSSRKSTSGRLTSPSAMSSRRRWPPDSSASSGLRGRRGESPASSARSRPPPCDMPCSRACTTSSSRTARRVQAAGLGDVADAAAHPRPGREQVVPGDRRQCRRGRSRVVSMRSGGRLAGAVRAEEAEDLTALHGQVDAAYGVDGASGEVKVGSGPGR